MERNYSFIDYAPQSVVFEMNLNDRDTQYNSFDDTFSHIVQRANTVVFASTVMSQKISAPLPPMPGTSVEKKAEVPHRACRLL